VIKTSVFVISGHLMFAHGLESLLRQEAQLDIVGQESDISQAIERIKELQPDVVILDSDNSTLEIASILETRPGIKVISLSLQNNNLQVYQARQRVTTSVMDLLEVIEEDLSSLKKTSGQQTPERNDE
jgi:DNA-binding NarL/FixJ family response regulator